MAQRMLVARRTISEIIAISYTPVLKDQIFSVHATVDGPYQGFGWFYATCSMCSKELDIYSGCFWCNICNGRCSYTTIRFRIHLHVGDDHGQTIFTMYNQQAEQLLDMCANKIVNRLGIGNNEFPQEISALTGKSFEFKIKMPDYCNKDADFHHIRIVRDSEVTPKPKPNCCIVSRKKLYHLNRLVPDDEGPSKHAKSVDTTCSVSKLVDLLDTATTGKED